MNPQHEEHRRIHRSGRLHAAVLGANNGIVSTASLTAGIAAAEATKGSIILAGTTVVGKLFGNESTQQAQVSARAFAKDNEGHFRSIPEDDGKSVWTYRRDNENKPVILSTIIE